MEFLYKINWILVGLLFGLFFGLFAVLFYVPYSIYRESKNILNYIKLLFIIVFQFIYNAAWPFAGGIGLLIFFNRLKRGFLGIPELLLLLMSVIALLGKFSEIIFKAPEALKEILLNKVSSKKGTDISIR